MKVNCTEKNSISFNGFYNSNGLKKGLSFAERNGALFASATALTLSALLRPPSILLTPHTDKKNKELACAKAVTSTLLDFGITLAVSVPIVKAIGKINKCPEKYLKNKTIENLKGQSESLKDSNAYTFANQLFKLGIGIAMAAPKAVLNVIGLPYISSVLFENNKEKNLSENRNVSFKGKERSNLTAIIGKLIDRDFIQNFSIANSESNFPLHINAIKDVLTTGVFVGGIQKSKKVDSKRKQPLIYNSIISTGLSIVSGYVIDSITQKPAEKFVKKLSEANKDDPNLKKYIDGFKIAKPVLILGVMYYGIIPLISTFLGERVRLNKAKEILKSND